jgi:hypothetical protein
MDSMRAMKGGFDENPFDNTRLINISSSLASSNSSLLTSLTSIRLQQSRTFWFWLFVLSRNYWILRKSMRGRWELSSEVRLTAWVTAVTLNPYVTDANLDRLGSLW